MSRLNPAALAAALTLILGSSAALADSTAQTLPFTQSWTDANLISSNDVWTGVPGVVGYLGDIDAVSPTNLDPRTLLLDYVVGPPISAVDVIANQATPNTSTAGGVAEFDGIANPVVALQGSGTADAPHLLLFLDTRNRANIRVRYNVRDIDGGTDNAVQQVALHYRVGASGSYVNVPAGYIADATTGPSLADLVTPVDIVLPPDANDQALVTLRIMSTNAPSNDEWVGIDDLQITGDGAGGLPIVSITSVAVAEGNVPGQTTAFNFTVNLSVPAPVGGTRFDASTSDGTATVAGADYQAVSLNDVLIAEGASSATVTVLVNHDLAGEANENFSVTLSDVQNGLIGTATGTGTIQNDDPLEIFQIQGSGTASTLVGSSVSSIDNVVTALAPNGFFMQTPASRDDNNLATSNGIFVFTGSAPTVAVGDRVTVAGQVQEFFGFTQISGSPTVQVTGNLPLPAAVILDAGFPSPLLATPSCFADADYETANFECIEGMRVSLLAGIVNAPNQRFGTDPLAEPYVVAGSTRSFREPGILTPGYAGIASSIPIWDGSPEVFEIDPDKLGLPNLAMTGGTQFSAEGVIGYDFNDFEIFPTAINITQAAPLPRPVAAATPGNLTIGSINMYRLFDTLAANNSTVTCTNTASYVAFAEEGDYPRRLAKFSTYVREVLRAPDVVAVQEVENLGVLQDLVAKIALDDPSMVYTAHLEEGNDVGGIDSGFLVRAGRINAGFTLTQLGKNDLFNLDSPPSCLHDRPPYRLDGVFSVGNRAFSVIVNHTRSFNGIGDCRIAASERICRKRLAQSESIAGYVQAFQSANPTVPLVVIGDHNAFEFTDGHVDTLGVIRGDAKLAGDPNPDSQIAPTADIVAPNLVHKLATLPVNERYSYFFDRAVQAIDHAMLSSAANAVFVGMSFGRANVDAPMQYDRTVANAQVVGDDLLPSGFESSNEWNPLNVSDHDGLVIRLFPE